MAEKKYPEGFWFDRHERAPDFIVGKVSISKERFMKWLEQQQPDAKGYIKLDVKRSREEGKYNVEIDTWVPTKRAEGRGGDNPRYVKDEIEDDIPFN